MLFAPIALVLGALIGLVARPASRRQPPLRAVPVLAAGALLLAVVELADLPGTDALEALATATLLIGVLRNLRLVGTTVVALGLAANLLVIGLNGHVPERPGPGHGLAEEGSRVGVLGDVVPVPGTDRLVSFGDLVALVGLTDLTAQLVRSRRRRAGVVIDLVALEREAAARERVREPQPA